jgi:hypothetical protein
MRACTYLPVVAKIPFLVQRSSEGGKKRRREGGRVTHYSYYLPTCTYLSIYLCMYVCVPVQARGGAGERGVEMRKEWKR